MRIAIVSDTHLPRFGKVLPRWLVGTLEAASVDRILHAGDWTTELAVDLLEAIAPVDGVAGNNDGPELHERFGTRRVIDWTASASASPTATWAPAARPKTGRGTPSRTGPTSTPLSSATATSRSSAGKPPAAG